MIQNITVNREDALQLSSEKWRFILLDEWLVLDSYESYCRPTRRHKYHTVRFYARLAGHTRDLTEEEAPLPQDVQVEALQKLRSQFKVGKQHDWRPRKP